MPTVDMRPQVLDINVYRGDTLVMELVFRDQQTNAAIDLTGMTFTSHVRAQPGSDEVAAQFECAVINASSGVLQMTLKQEDMEHLHDRFWYDVQGESSAQTRTFLRGQLLFEKDVTR